MKRYAIGIDQSTQGTKAILVDENGMLLKRCDRLHRQIIDRQGWVEHDPQEIYRNVVLAVSDLLKAADVPAEAIACIGISNQRETGMVWNRRTGKPLYNAIVWQCARGKAICEGLETGGSAAMVKQHTGLNLSPYFTAAKIAWILQNVPQAQQLNLEGNLCIGTMDSWVLYNLTKGASFQTDYSNASRTQMFDIRNLRWDSEVCSLFGIRTENLPEVCFSDGNFGSTDIEGLLPMPVPIHAIMGDSHASLYGHGCHSRGMVKSTYGTGSSVMMNIGPKPVFCKDIVTSLAWGINGKVDYVLEGNINYSAAVVTWLKDDLKLIDHSSETEALALAANPCDTTYLVPAFSGIGAPYWASDAKASLVGMTRCTGKNEVVRAALDSIAYQIHDILEMMERDAGIPVRQLRVDGEPTHNQYLMQFQSDILQKEVLVPNHAEVSGMGAACLAGIAQGLMKQENVFGSITSAAYRPAMDGDTRQRKLDGWNEALHTVLGR